MGVEGTKTGATGGVSGKTLPVGGQNGGYGERRGSVLQVVGDGGDDAYLFYIWGVAVAVLDGECALAGGLYLSEPAVGVLGELLGCPDQRAELSCPRSHSWEVGS